MNENTTSSETQTESKVSEVRTTDQPTPIADFVARPDFPECTLNQVVDIGGYTGVVVSIVRQSLKVKPPEGLSQSFNYNTLRKLYGPRQEIAAMPEPKETAAPAEPEQPKRNVITEPDFSAPVKQITEFTGRTDFPQCVFGQHVDVGGYVGVVVEIVNRSLKVRSQEETTRSYNADVLRKLHPAPKAQS